MASSIALPRRFSAYGEPTDGLVAITDTKTGRSTMVGLTYYAQFVQSLNELLGLDEDLEAEDAPADAPDDPPSSAEVKKAPAVKTEAAKKRRAPRSRRGPAETNPAAGPATSPVGDKSAAEAPASQSVFFDDDMKPVAKRKRGRLSVSVKTPAPEAPELSPADDVVPDEAPQEVAPVKPKRRASTKGAKSKASPPEGNAVPRKAAQRRPARQAAPLEAKSAEAKAPAPAPTTRRAGAKPAQRVVKARPIEGKGYVLVPTSDADFPLYEIIATSGKKLGTIQQSAGNGRFYVTPKNQKKFPPTDHTNLLAAKTRAFIIAR